MTFYFRSHRSYLTRDKHDPRRRWLVYAFKTRGGVIITLKQALVVRHIITKELRVYED